MKIYDNLSDDKTAIFPKKKNLFSSQKDKILSVLFHAKKYTPHSTAKWDIIVHYQMEEKNKENENLPEYWRRGYQQQPSADRVASS